jgi:uncharacterized membrane protein
MPGTVLRLAVLLCVTLLTGTMFGIWVSFNPSELSAGAWVELHQQMVRALNTPMPLFGLISIVLTIALAVHVRRVRSASWLLVAAAVCLVSAGLVTRFLNQPINAEVMTWNIQSPPPAWTTLRDRWWHWHTIRTCAALAALFLVILETLVERRYSQSDTH